MRQPIAFVGLIAVAATAVVGSPAQSYEVAPVAGGGTIEGVVRYRGAVPMKKIIPTKDTEVCGTPREDPMVRVGADQAVESAVVFLVDVAKGKAWPAAAKPPEINNVKCRFEPEVQAMPAGTLSVLNSDAVLHNTHGYVGKRTVFNLALPNQGQRIPTDLRAPGHGSRRLRRAWLDGRVDPGRGQSLPCHHRRRRQVQHHGCAAGKLQARGVPTLHRADGDARHRDGGAAHEARHRAEEEMKGKRAGVKK